MNQYLLLIHGNTKTEPSAGEWAAFLATARESGLFRGGSAIGGREIVGDTSPAGSSAHLAGYMRFDSEAKEPVLALLRQHPVVRHGGTVELCDLPRS